MTAKYIAENGMPITDEMLEEWAREAEEGRMKFEPLTDEDRAKRKRVLSKSTHSIRITDSVWNLAKEEASAHDMSMSAYTQDALIEKVARARNKELLAGV